jgi:signal transduction histidine kinase
VECFLNCDPNVQIRFSFKIVTRLYKSLVYFKLPPILFALLILGVPILTSGQVPLDKSKVDSLRALLPLVSGVDKYRAEFGIAYELFDFDNKEAVRYAELAYSDAQVIGDSVEIVKSGRLYGQLLRRIDRLDAATNIFLQVLPIAERNGVIDEQKRILNALAIAYNYMALYDKALEYNFKSLEIREREGNNREIGIGLSGIGFVYYKMGDFDQALDFFLRAIEFRKADTLDLDQLYINVALCYVYKRQFTESQDFVFKAFGFCKDKCSDQVKIEGEFCLGMSNESIGKLEKAREHFNESYNLSVRTGDKRFQAENLLWLGMVDLRERDFSRAEEELIKAEQLASEFGYNQLLINSFHQLSTLFFTTEDFHSAARYQLKYITLKDSIYSDDLIKNITRVQTNYAERENINTIAEQDEVLRLNQIVIERQRQVYFFVALIAGLSVLIALVFLRYSRALTKAKMQLSMANQTLERRVEDRTKALQNVNNELDNFIYKTSHDIRGPLASLKGIANVALLELTDAKAQDYLHKLDASADKLNTILTRLLIVNQINHAVLTPVSIDFPELIQEILTWERKKGIPSRLIITHEIDPNVKLITDRHILRIILENLIDNAIKYHNSSDRVEPFVQIKVVPVNHHGVKINVIDNGIGIKEHDPQKLFQMFVRASERSESGGIGLYLTKLASERLYAKVDFSTNAEKHTQFAVTLPADLREIIVEKEKEAV